MGDKVKSIIVTVITVLLCIAIMATGTFALFTDRVDVKNHLKSGELDVQLFRTTLTKVALNDDGILEKYVDEEDVEFTNPTDKNIFDVVVNDENSDLMVPMAYYEAEMLLKNNGDVAFTYDVRITFDGADAENLKFAEQLLVEVTGVNGSVIRSVNLRNIVDNEIVIAGGTNDFLMTPGAERTFTVKVTFQDLDKDGSVNNAAMNQSCEFDLAVYAVQYTEVIDNTVVDP